MTEPASKRRRPATTPDGREQQLIFAAIEMAEEQILNRTASSQTLSHYLKLGSSRERLEQERLEQENNLLRAKIDAMQSSARVEELYTEAINAMRSYNGHD